MKIALICPSNMLFMPYVNNYITVLENLNVNYTIINWDRFSLEVEEDNSEFIYKDKKNGHQRNYYDYYKYKKFVLNKLKQVKYDKIIIFTLQLGYFLKRYLLNNYKEKYILDIRDYNKIFKFSSFEKLINCSYFTVISSPGYKLWLPYSDKYVVNHNTSVENLEDIQHITNKISNKKINISTIGVIRHWNVNVDFINQLKNNDCFDLIFHGEGTINHKLKEYIKKQKINNVRIHGRYKQEEEGRLYESADMINILLYDNINSKGVLANRLYNAVVYGKPMLSLKGTYLADQIEKYNLGLVIKYFDNLETQIEKYLNQFDKDKYQNGRISFLDSIIKESEKFKIMLEKFILI